MVVGHRLTQIMVREDTNHGVEMFAKGIGLKHNLHIFFIVLQSSI